MNRANRAALTLAVFTACISAMPAAASTILPNLYAAKFCELRAQGASKDDAMQVALNEARVEGEDWITITIWGKQRRSDIVQSIMAVNKLCPELTK